MKTMQKLRDRPNGVNIVSLALGEKLSQEEEKLMVSKLILPQYKNATHLKYNGFLFLPFKSMFITYLL